VQQTRIIDWFNNIKREEEQSEYLQVKRFVTRNKLNIERSNTSTVRQWILNVKEIKRKSKCIPKNDI